MKRPTNLKIGDQFRVIVKTSYFKMGEIISLKRDDGTVNPYFWNENKSNSSCIHFSFLEPHIKTVRDAQVGDVIVGKASGAERMVLERWQNSVLLSREHDFKTASNNYTFDELEKYFTLKDTPVVDDKIAEAMELLEEAGYKIEKKKGKNE